MTMHIHVVRYGPMTHRVKRPPPLPAPPLVDGLMEQAIARTSQAFATASRIRILVRLWRGPAPVSELAADIGMEQSTLSHQLRLLRDLRLVDSSRNGRQVVYRLHDDHVAIMLNEAIYHVEHLRLEAAGQSAAAQVAGATSRTARQLSQPRSGLRQTTPGRAGGGAAIS
jgi:DNA-binding transcriptional ArsR family regulator